MSEVKSISDGVLNFDLLRYYFYMIMVIAGLDFFSRDFDDDDDQDGGMMMPIYQEIES